ncbi:hypothetical protein AC578_5895 [Pseudocercospora eumusae]|uniref:Uncharacterized protein n=1 Tax=Pseudocercospora eumusae TaxID=321146 RepID=A0A139HBH4_9PEZI|nr:hypothetical protein AC578_5895 [Pseudocercospora eumusae]
MSLTTRNQSSNSLNKLSTVMVGINPHRPFCPGEGDVYLDGSGKYVIDLQTAKRRWPYICRCSGTRGEQHDEPGCFHLARPPPPPTLHMFWYDMHTRTMHISNAGEIDYKKYRVVVVTEKMRYLKALEPGHGVVEVSKRKWWQRAWSRPKWAVEVGEASTGQTTSSSSQNSWPDGYPYLKDLLI